MRRDQTFFTSVWLSNCKSRTLRQSAAVHSPHSLVTGFTNRASDWSSGLQTAPVCHLIGIKNIYKPKFFFQVSSHSPFPLQHLLIMTIQTAGLLVSISSLNYPNFNATITLKHSLIILCLSLITSIAGCPNSDQLSLHYEILLDSKMSERHFIQLNRPILKDHCLFWE